MIALNPQTVTLATLRRRASIEGINVRWSRSGFNHNGLGEYIIVDAINNTLIGTAPNEMELREWLIELMKDAAEAAR
ncbi:hypothetical protein [Aquabacterium sp. A08]|uniref:hypothetical protein n=1 Tax=Aquabacterium sp. A08 TaxID=2718532 RepID=UPI0014232F07|nr:hypothetical protein [Aquabacterium sp. A08]NIC43313.1 hypothetical protein [Aquabacterium sp. A08]